MMRTSSRAWSISRLISGPALSSVAEEGLEAGQAGALVGKAEAQELVEDFAGVVAEPGDHLRADAVAAEDRGIELEDRL